MNFSKVLTYSEAQWKFVRLPIKIREEEFPEKDKLFDMKFQEKTYKLKVNNPGNIMITPLFEKHKFEPGETITIKTGKNGFEFSVGK